MSLNSTSLAAGLGAFSSAAMPSETEHRLLRFALDHQDNALLPLAQIVEILRLNMAEVLPIPDLPSCVLGIYNWRGEILWLIDFNALFGYPPIPQQKQGVAPPYGIVIQGEQQCLGFVVSQVHEIELHDLQNLQPTVVNLFPPNLLPFVLGVVPTSGDPVLDMGAIAQSNLWQREQSDS